MENRKGKRLQLTQRPRKFFPLVQFLFSILLFTSGCGAPGDPVPPSARVPVAINDLTARQAGDGVELSFTLPSISITGEKLPSPPAVEILRGISRADGSSDPRSFRVVYTIPGVRGG